MESNFSLRVHDSALRDLNVQPVEAFWHVVVPQSTPVAQTNDTSPSPSSPYSDLIVTLPLAADKIEIRWLDKPTVMARGEEDMSSTQTTHQTTASSSNAGSSAKKDTRKSETPPPPEDVGPQMTVLHEVMHSVGEGIVRSTHIVEYTSSSSSSELSSTPAVFALHGGKVRITAIEGHAVQSWDIVSSTKDDQQVVRVVWKRSHLDSTASLLVHTESDRTMSREQVELPRIECRDVLRHAGHVGVSARCKCRGS